ncbi:hypothetical protein KBC03_02905 [Patescibacteria group bacterium]|nr:hypothetical protein [Patescibacteria group bacterium]
MKNVYVILTILAIFLIGGWAAMRFLYDQPGGVADIPLAIGILFMLPVIFRKWRNLLVFISLALLSTGAFSLITPEIEDFFFLFMLLSIGCIVLAMQCKRTTFILPMPKSAESD